MQENHAVTTGPFVGAPLSRREGYSKVTGRALYTAETSLPGTLHAVLVKSTIAAGRIERLHTADAQAAEGVVAVLTHENFPRLQPIRVMLDPGGDGALNKSGAGQQHLPLQDEKIVYRGQDIAVVVAVTPEQAHYAASLVNATYQETPPRVDLSEAADLRFSPGKAWADEADVLRGHLSSGLAEATAKVDQAYTTSIQHHVTMEPHATIAVWQERS